MFTSCHCVRCVSLFFPISPSAPFIFPAASLHPLSGICAVRACGASFGSACVIYCYIALPCPIHVSHLPLVSIVVAPAVCSHSLSRFACYFFLCLSMLLFCTPSVGWLSWLFSFLSVHRGRLLLFSFVFGPSLRCIASVVCLGWRSLSATSLSLPYYIILVAPCFKKSFKIRSWVPSPQMP